MTAKRAPFVQFSKRLAVGITIFWCAFRILALILLLLRPSLSGSMQGIMQGADDVMMCNIGFYCGNSVAEKGILGYFSSRTKEQNNDEG